MQKEITETHLFKHKFLITSKATKKKKNTKTKMPNIA